MLPVLPQAFRIMILHDTAGKFAPADAVPVCSDQIPALFSLAVYRLTV